jgi:thiol:disulfide interchange protein DsbD
MALTFTITSFTCTGPFLGAMMAPVAALQPAYWQLALAALVYSLTFAAPFFVLALFPTLLKRLPKSGGWLNAVKVTMGFLEIGAALKFLSNTDLVWNPGDPKLFNYDTVLCAWMALCVACGMYLIGVFRLPHDDKTEHIGVVRMLIACVFFGLAVYMTPLLRGETPSGVVGEGIVAFLPPSYRHASELPWNLKSEQAFAEWKGGKDKKLVFIDFTGQQCTNCRANEKNVFARSDVQKELKKYVLLQAFTDSVPIKGLDASAAKALGREFLAWQEKIVSGNLTLPTYVILEVDAKDPFPDGQFKGKVVGTRDGLIIDVNDFLSFIRKPVNGKETLQAKAGDVNWEQPAIQKALLVPGQK